MRIISWAYKKRFLLENKLFTDHLTRILLREYKAQVVGEPGERAVEYAFMFKYLSKICPSKVLDVGPGQSAFPSLLAYCGFHVTAVDKKTGYWKEPLQNRHFLVIEDDITNPQVKERYDMITCVSTLEHIPDHLLAVKGMFSLLNPGGHLALTAPYNEGRYVTNVYALPEAGYGQNYPFVCQVFSRKEIDAWLRENHATVVDQEYWDVFTGVLWTFGKYHTPKESSRHEPHHLTCILFQKNQ